MVRTRRRTLVLLSLHQHRAVAMVLLSVTILAIGALNWSQASARPQFTWACTAALLLGAIAIMGGAVNGRLEGVLIDNRNRISLSKFQMLLWTVVVLSGLISAASLNILRDHANALDIAIPGELLFAMGIAATSFIVTPALLQLKTNQESAPGTLASTVNKLDLGTGQAEAAGRVFALASPQLASWTDMFLGDDVGNAASADISKVQQFSITMLLIGIYVGMLWHMFGKATAAATAAVMAAGKGELTIATLPVLSQGFVMLMAISHASYLAYKAVPHEKAAKDDGRDPRFDPVG